MSRQLQLLPGTTDVERGVERRLPLAALEFESPSAAIIATPLPGLARTINLVVFLLVVAMLIASGLIRIDKIVSAAGKLVAEEPNIVMQPFDRSIIESIEVRKGDIVRKGQVLARLNPTLTVADLTALKDQVDLFSARNARLSSQTAGGNFAPDGTNPHSKLQVSIFDQQTSEYNFSLHNFDQKIDQANTEIVGASSQAGHYRQRLEIAAAIEDMRKKLQVPDRSIATGLCARHSREVHPRIWFCRASGGMIQRGKFQQSEIDPTIEARSKWSVSLCVANDCKAPVTPAIRRRSSIFGSVSCRSSRLNLPVRNARLTESDWYFNRALFNINVALGNDSGGFEAVRGGHYWMNSA